MKNGIRTELLITIISGILLALSPPARGDATVDWDFDNGFYPATVVIGPSEKVTWWNVDIYGFGVSITFASGLNFYLPQYHGAQVTFPSQTGSYNYSSDYGDYGTVIVNVAPSVSITSPADGAVLSAPANFTIAATASDTADDYVSDVEFFLGTGDGTNSIEDVFSAPFSTAVTNLAAGAYTLLAVARDSHGWAATNAITITVTAGAGVNLESPRMAGEQFLFDAAGLTAGKTNVVEVSSNLVSWKPMQTNIASGASMTVSNPAAVMRQFFRLVQLP